MVPDEDRRRGDRGLSLQPRGAAAGTTEEADRPATATGRELVAEIEAVIAELPTYGYRRVHAILKRRALATGRKPPNHKRVHRVMKAGGLLLAGDTRSLATSV